MHHMPEPPGRLRELLKELKRRRVFRVASFYVVAAWAVIEASATVFPALNLPNKLVTFVVVAAIIGLPVTLILSWLFDITSEGIVRTGPEGEDDERRVRVARVPWLKPAVTVVSVVVVAAGAWTVASVIRRRTAPPENASIAVFPFHVDGSPSLSYLREGMVTLVSTSLNGAGQVHVIDPNTLIRSLSDPKKDVDASQARRIARQFSATYFVLGSITETGSGVLVRGRLYDVGKDAPLTTIAVPGSKEDIPGLVDHFAEVLLSDQLQREGMHLASTAALTTSSMPALKAYLTGESEYRASEWGGAADQFKQATQLDSTFALAYYRLALAAEWYASSFKVVDDAADHAYRLRDRLSTHDKDLVVAFHAWTKGDAATAERLYRKITSEQPEDAEAWYRLGEVLFHYGPVRGHSFVEARPAFRKALAAAPDEQPILHHLMQIALYEHDDAAFDSLSARAGLEGPAVLRRTAAHTLEEGDSAKVAETLRDLKTSWGGDVFAVATGLAEFAHDLNMADRVARLLTDSKREAPIRGAGYLLMAQVAAGRGRWADADAALDTLRTIHAPTALVYRALYASVPFLHVPEAELRRIWSDLETWKPGPSDDIDAPGAFLGIHNGAWPLLRLYTLGLVTARLAEFPAARGYAAKLDAWSRKDSLPTPARRFAARLAHGIRMRLAVAGQAVPDSVALEWPPVDASLDQIANSAFYAQSLGRYTRGLLLAKAGRPKAAVKWLVAATQGRNELFLLGPAEYALGEAYAAMGQKARAARYLSDFLAEWKGADPQARGVLARVREQRKGLTPG